MMKKIILSLLIFFSFGFLNNTFAEDVFIGNEIVPSSASVHAVGDIFINSNLKNYYIIRTYFTSVSSRVSPTFIYKNNYGKNLELSKYDNIYAGYGDARRRHARYENDDFIIFRFQGNYLIFSKKSEKIKVGNFGKIYYFDGDFLFSDKKIELINDEIILSNFTKPSSAFLLPKNESSTNYGGGPSYYCFNFSKKNACFYFTTSRKLEYKIFNVDNGEQNFVTQSILIDLDLKKLQSYKFMLMSNGTQDLISASISFLEDGKQKFNTYLFDEETKNLNLFYEGGFSLLYNSDSEQIYGVQKTVDSKDIKVGPYYNLLVNGVVFDNSAITYYFDNSLNFYQSDSNLTFSKKIGNSDSGDSGGENCITTTINHDYMINMMHNDIRFLGDTSSLEYYNFANYRQNSTLYSTGTSNSGSYIYYSNDEINTYSGKLEKFNHDKETVTLTFYDLDNFIYDYNPLYEGSNKKLFKNFSFDISGSWNPFELFTKNPKIKIKSSKYIDFVRVPSVGNSFDIVDCKDYKSFKLIKSNEKNDFGVNNLSKYYYFEPKKEVCLLFESYPGTTTISTLQFGFRHSEKIKAEVCKTSDDIITVDGLIYNGDTNNIGKIPDNLSPDTEKNFFQKFLDFINWIKGLFTFDKGTLEKVVNEIEERFKIFGYLKKSLNISVPTTPSTVSIDVPFFTFDGENKKIGSSIYKANLVPITDKLNVNIIDDGGSTNPKKFISFLLSVLYIFIRFLLLFLIFLPFWLYFYLAHNMTSFLFGPTLVRKATGGILYKIVSLTYYGLIITAIAIIFETVFSIFQFLDYGINILESIFIYINVSFFDYDFFMFFVNGFFGLFVVYFIFHVGYHFIKS